MEGTEVSTVWICCMGSFAGSPPQRALSGDRGSAGSSGARVLSPEARQLFQDSPRGTQWRVVTTAAGSPSAPRVISSSGPEQGVHLETGSRLGHSDPHVSALSRGASRVCELPGDRTCGEDKLCPESASLF